MRLDLPNALTIGCAFDERLPHRQSPRGAFPETITIGCGVAFAAIGVRLVELKSKIEG